MPTPTPPPLPAMFRDIEPTEFKQQRAAATHRRLLRAAARVFERVGYDGATVADIAARARVSVGAFYRHFPDKRTAFLDVLRRHLADTLAEVLGRVQPKDFTGSEPRPVLDVILDVLFARAARTVELDRVYLSMSLVDPDVRRMRAEFEAFGIDTISYLIEAAIPRAVVPHPRAAAIVCSIAAYEIAAERAGMRPRAGAITADADVKWALRELLARFLFPAP